MLLWKKKRFFFSNFVNATLIYFKFSFSFVLQQTVGVEKRKKIMHRFSLFLSRTEFSIGKLHGWKKREERFQFNFFSKSLLNDSNKIWQTLAADNFGIERRLWSIVIRCALRLSEIAEKNTWLQFVRLGRVRLRTLRIKEALRRSCWQMRINVRQFFIDFCWTRRSSFFEIQITNDDDCFQFDQSYIRWPTES